MNLKDDTHAWTLGEAGRWQAVESTESLCAQEIFKERAAARAETRSEEAGS